MTNLEKQYQENLQAYKDLGLQIPASLETVEQNLTKHQKEAISKDKGQLVIAPAITENFMLHDLVEEFDKKHDYVTGIYERLWNQYDFTSSATIAVINLELKGTNKTVEQQRKMKGTFLEPVEYIMLQAMKRPKYLDEATFCRFPQYPSTFVGGDSFVPVASSLGSGRVYLDGSSGIADSCDGVRLSVGKRIELSTSSSNLPSHSSPELNEEQVITFLKNKGYEIWRKL